MKLTAIRLRRLNAKLSSEETIKALGINKNTFYYLEQGKTIPRATLIKKMSELYKCSTDDIFKDLEIEG